MSRTLPTAALAILSTLLLSAPALARPAGPPPLAGPPNACDRARHAEMLARYDADKNGRLDHSEREAAHRDRRAADLAAYDKDGDGELSRAERAELHHDRTVERFEELDTSGDAAISRAEANAGCGPLKHTFDRVDRDGDGNVSWTEFERATRRHHPHRRPGARDKRSR